MRRHDLLTPEALKKRYSDPLHGKIVHDPSLDMIPSLFEGVAFHKEHAAKLPVYITYLKYELFELWAFGVTPEGIPIAVEIINFRPFVYVRRSESPPAGDLLSTISQWVQPRRPQYQKSRRSYYVDEYEGGGEQEPVADVSIEPERHWIAPPAPIGGKTDVWKLTFPSWQMLQRVVGRMRTELHLNVLQHEHIKCELLYMFARGIRLHQWALLDRNRCQTRADAFHKTTAPFELLAEHDALAPFAACETIAPQLVMTFDIETISERGIKLLRDSVQLQDWIRSLLLNAFVPDLAPVAKIVFRYMEVPAEPCIFMIPLAHKKNDHCVTISTHFFYGDHQGNFLQVRHCLGTALPSHKNPNEALTLTFSKEADMLRHWVHMLRYTFDVELIGGHNSIDYDMVYLYDRTTTLSMTDFKLLTRYRTKANLTRRETEIATKRRGKMKKKRIDIPGVRQFDTMELARQMEPTLEDHTLKTCAAKLLKGFRKKKDLPYAALAPFWILGPYTRWEILEYNDRDTLLVDELVRYGLLGFAIECSSDTYTPLLEIVVCGQTVRCANQEASTCFYGEVLMDHNARRRLMRIAGEKLTYEDRLKYYDPEFHSEDRKDDMATYAEQEAKKKQQKEKRGRKAEKKVARYKGARLVELICGFYQYFVSTLDFEGLYPNICISYRLCFTRWIPHQDKYDHAKLTSNIERIAKGFDPKMIEFPTLPPQAKVHCWFINELSMEKTRLKIEVNEYSPDTWIIEVVGYGKERSCMVYEWPKEKEQPKLIVPDSCASAIRTRKEAKAKAKAAKKAEDWNIYAKFNAQQLAKKVACNSIYGFKGAKDGPGEFIFISQMICLNGRCLNLFTENTLKHRYGRTCIYGDTDSVMPVFPDVTLEAAYKECIDASSYITSQLPGVKLEFENLKQPSLFLTPKGYAYVLVWDAERGRLEKGELKTTGLADKRRNYGGWGRKIYFDVLRALLLPEFTSDPDRDSKLLNMLFLKIGELESGKVTPVELARTCKIQSEYDGKQKLAQKDLAERMLKRGQDIRGSRVWLVYVKDGSKPLSQRAEIPDYVVARKMQVDIKYYKEELCKNVEKLLAYHPAILRAFKQRIYGVNPISSYFTSSKSTVRVVP